MIPRSPTTAALTNETLAGTEKLTDVVGAVVAGIIEVIVVCIAPSTRFDVSHDVGSTLPMGQ
jgi:hypothetical protein